MGLLARGLAASKHRWIPIPSVLFHRRPQLDVESMTVLFLPGYFLSCSFSISGCGLTQFDLILVWIFTFPPGPSWLWSGTPCIQNEILLGENTAKPKLMCCLR